MTCRYPLYIPVLFLSIVLSCKEKQENNTQGRSRSIPKADVSIVKAESYEETIIAPGTIVANEVVEIHPEIAGRLTELNVREGQAIKKGDIIGHVYDLDLKAQLNKLKAQLNIARVNEERASQLIAIEGISKQDYDNTKLNVQNIEADIAILETSISRAAIRAPFDGKMGLRQVSIGEYVTPATVIATINQTSTLKVDFSVPEKYSGRINQGHIIDFTLENNTTTYSAKVIASQSNIATENRSLTYRAVVVGNSAGLVPGAFARVRIGFAPNPNAIFIPSQSIVPTAIGKQVILYHDGKALFNDVVTGLRDSSRVEIIRGLKPGDTILVTGMMATKPDSKIIINKIISN